MPVKKTVLLVAAAAITALLGVEYLRLLKPAQAREVEAACRGLKPTARNPALGVLPTRAPEFEAQDHTGKMVKLSDFRGKVVLLRFWGSWCETCKAEQPSLEDVAQTGGDLVVIAVASDESWEPIRKKLPGGSNAIVLIDPPEDGAIGPLAEAYGVGAMPESFIIDRNGIARYYMANRRDWRGAVARTCLRSVLDE
jgi:thiol-disulfide isomerase/thioredoxin